MDPERITPETTQPTKGTEKTSEIDSSSAAFGSNLLCDTGVKALRTYSVVKGSLDQSGESFATGFDPLRDCKPCPRQEVKVSQYHAQIRHKSILTSPLTFETKKMGAALLNALAIAMLTIVQEY